MRIKDWSMLGGARVWRRHPGVRTGAELTRGERAADWMRAIMGSWGFVLGMLLFLAGWMVGNRSGGFDPYPFILLNLVLSCMAAMQGAILLIAARRSDQVSAELAVHDFETNDEALRLIREILAVLGDGTSSPGPSGGDGATA